MARGSNSAGVKKSASTNGVSKAKKSIKKLAAAASDEEASTVVEVVAVDDVSETGATVKPVAKAKKTKKTARTTESSGGSAGGRVRKAPERYEAVNAGPQVPIKKARTGGSKEFPVEAIRGIKKESGSYSFLVKWEGYTEKSNNWEPEANVRMCKTNIQKFLDQVNKHVNTFP